MKRPKLSEITSKHDTLEQMGQKIVKMCTKYNVDARYDLLVDNDDKEDVLLILDIVGYKDSGIKEFWQSKINPIFTLDVWEKEEDNVFHYIISLK